MAGTDILTEQDLEPRLTWALGLAEGDARPLTLERFARRVCDLVPLDWPLDEEERRAILEIAQQTQMLTLTAGAPPWWESADILHYVVGLSIKRIPASVVARLARNAARNRPPGEERELALQTLDRAPDLGLVAIVKHGLLWALAAAGYVTVWDGGPQPRPPTF